MHTHVIRLIISFATEDGEILYSQQKTRPGVNCGIDHELLTAKFRLKLKKGGETTRPFRYDLNQIPYDYTVEMMNRFKGLVSDRQDCPKKYGWKFIILYENHLQEKEMQKAKWLSEEALQIDKKRRGAFGKEKGKNIPN